MRMSTARRALRFLDKVPPWTANAQGFGKQKKPLVLCILSIFTNNGQRCILTIYPSTFAQTVPYGLGSQAVT